MSKLKEFHDTEQALKQQLQLLESLKKNAILMKELEFESKLKALMKRYRKTLGDIITLQEHSVPSPDNTVHEQPASYRPRASEPQKRPESKRQRLALQAQTTLQD